MSIQDSSFVMSNITWMLFKNKISITSRQLKRKTHRKTMTVPLQVKDWLWGLSVQNRYEVNRVGLLSNKVIGAIRLTRPSLKKTAILVHRSHLSVLPQTSTKIKMLQRCRKKMVQSYHFLTLGEVKIIKANLKLTNLRQNRNLTNMVMVKHHLRKRKAVCPKINNEIRKNSTQQIEILKINYPNQFNWKT